MNDRQTMFSVDRTRRYALWRDWSSSVLFEGCNDGERGRDSFVQFIGLNPSTADETKDDPTIRRCVGFAKKWGYGAMCMTNLFSFVTAYPEELTGQTFADQLNADSVFSIAGEADLVIACWGNFSQAIRAAESFKSVFRAKEIKLHHLGLNQNGSPKHPLYLSSKTQPIQFDL